MEKLATKLPQGNRVNELSPDDANQKLIVPSRDLPLQASESLLDALLSRFCAIEIGRSMIGPDAAFVVAEDHFHHPMQTVSTP